ncbi:MAG: hypothetical protein HKN76_09075 [Saprospiraceae bacterium]|nr:hypothetical protein [Saprospiraceae bacterium]
MDRRSFVLLSATGAVALTIPVACSGFGTVRYDPILNQPQSLTSLLTPDQISSIGKKYREKVPKEKTVNAIARKLLDDISAEGDALIAAIDKKIKKDFETGNTAFIEGWVLSVTEARQCALSTLATQNA